MTSPYVQETVQIHNSVLKNLHHSGIPLLSYKANAPWHLTIAVRWDNVAREMRRQSKAKGPAVHLPAERIAQRIIIVRGHKVLLDFDLAAIYGVETRTLVQAVKRNAARFPLDFMFQLTVQELASWRSQFVISNVGSKKGLRRPPYAFTEQGVAMLSSVLHSEAAIAANVEIIRTFVRLRQILGTHKDLARKLDELESKYDEQFAVVFDAIRKLMNPPAVGKKNRIGYIISDD